jgi:hypothetical protein
VPTQRAGTLDHRFAFSAKVLGKAQRTLRRRVKPAAAGVNGGVDCRASSYLMYRPTVSDRSRKANEFQQVAHTIGSSS